VRESDLVLMTHAGPEIGVASTKAFTTQLVALMLLVILIGKRHQLSAHKQKELVAQLSNLPARVSKVFESDKAILALAHRYQDKQHALFLGRGSHYPIAMEGALKLKEISYVHAEAYAAGELKHGPIALIDENMPVITVAPNNELLAKLKSNIQEVHARGGELHVFADISCDFKDDKTMQLIEIDAPENAVAPIIFNIPLQLLAYHVAVLKGTDVDQPRNLAKSVTVE
jgi:glucosamine--fructose-6-phosphate aminotransferase (isomerizing)